MKNIRVVFFITFFIMVLGILVILPVSLKVQIITVTVIFICLIILILSYFKPDKTRYPY